MSCPKYNINVHFIKVQFEIYQQGLSIFANPVCFFLCVLQYCPASWPVLYYTWTPTGKGHILSSLCKKAHYRPLTDIYSLYFLPSHTKPVSSSFTLESLWSFHLNTESKCVSHFWNHFCCGPSGEGSVGTDGETKQEEPPPPQAAFNLHLLSWVLLEKKTRPEGDILPISILI